MDGEDDDFISKTRRKKEMHALQNLGKELVAMSPERLARIEMPEVLREAVMACKRFNKHEAIRRQMQYIGRIMRDIDAEPIAAQLATMKAPSARDTALFHLAEKWRTELIEDPEAITRFTRDFPDAGHPQLRALVEKARADRAAGRGPRSFRELFHFVNDAVQKKGKAA